jgi:DNA repair protein RadD
MSPKDALGQKFDDLVVGPQPPDAVRLGAALPCRGFTLTGVLDLDTLHIRNGEYIDSEIASQACRPEALEHVFNEWKRLCFRRPTLHVGATIEQALLTRDHFLSHGVAAETIIGSTAPGARQAIFERVRQGKTQVITSVGCLSFGFNLPPISAVVYVRATKSKALFHQTGGRGSRPSPGKIDFLLLDFGGNLKRHGSPMGLQNYDIGPLKQEDIPPLTKTCPGCGAEVNVFAQICSLCGYEFSVVL